MYVGYLLLPIAQMRDKNVKFTMFDMAIALAMGAITIATFSLDKSMLFGFVVYSARHLASHQKINWWLIGSTILLASSVIAQYSMK